MLHIKGSAEHSRCTCLVDRPSRSADEQLHNNAPHRTCFRKKTTACVSLFVFFTVRRGPFPYSIEDDSNTTTQTPTTHYTNTCVKLTIVTHLSFSERIAIANLSLEKYCSSAYTSDLESQKITYYLLSYSACSNLLDQSTTHKNVSQEYFFCPGKNVYGVIGVQYTALCENEKNEKNQHPNPAQQE